MITPLQSKQMQMTSPYKTPLTPDCKLDIICATSVLSKGIQSRAMFVLWHLFDAMNFRRQTQISTLSPSTKYSTSGDKKHYSHRQFEIMWMS